MAPLQGKKKKKKNEVPETCAECDNDVFVDDAATGTLVCTVMSD